MKINFTRLLFAMVLLYTNSIYSQVIKSKDGKVVGDLEEIVESCVAAAQTEVVKFDNVEFKLEDYCTCMATGVLPNLTLKELETAIQNNSFQQLLLREDNLAILQKCAEENVSIDSAFVYSKTYDNAQLRPYFVKSCVNGMFSDDGIEEFITETQAAQICNCALDKMFEQGFTYGQIANFANEISPEFEAIVLGCIPKELIEEMQDNK